MHECRYKQISAQVKYGHLETGFQFICDLSIFGHNNAKAAGKWVDLTSRSHVTGNPVEIFICLVLCRLVVFYGMDLVYIIMH